MAGRSGYWKNNLSGEASYRSFVPADLPPEPDVALNPEDLNLLIKANNRLALLDGLSSRIPNVNLFISMYVRKEALMSSQIEGTQATLEDIFDPTIAKNANQNIADVINYIKATEFAIHRLTELPLCSRLIREAHAILTGTGRGQEKTPGEFRQSQNWIGGHGNTLKTARYIPPTPEDMQDAMSKLERYMNTGDRLGGSDLLIQAALIHYQFETIHPFSDGNGRIGRLLVTLFLMEKHVLSAPVLYISYSLKRNRVEYYDHMMAVREKGEYEQWVRFFLEAVLESANDATEAIDKLVLLHERNTSLIQTTGRSAKTVRKVFGCLEANPITTVGKTADTLGISYNTAADAINKLCDAGILRQTDNAQRNRAFVYEEYLDILRSGT